jgi:predicted transcriptional regulator
MNELQLLKQMVDRYDAQQRPLTLAELVDCVDAEETTVESCVQNFQSNHLVTRVDERGYRPTVTARELLELGLTEESVLIVDTEPEDAEW